MPRLNVYKYMLETEYGFVVSGMYLGQVHPCLPRARLIEVPCMKAELELIVEDQINLGEAISGALPEARFALPEEKGAQIRWACVPLCRSYQRIRRCCVFSLRSSLSMLVSFPFRARGSRDNVLRKCCSHSLHAIPSLEATS